MKEVLSKVPWETIYEETGGHQTTMNTLFQLGAEKPRRLKRTRLLPIADGFNFLLSGVPRIEMSLASTTQLYNPVTRTWSDRLSKALRLPPELFAHVVPAGTKLGALRPEIMKETHLEDARVVASCSHEMAAALAGLPGQDGNITIRPGNRIPWSACWVRRNRPPPRRSPDSPASRAYSRKR